MPVGSDAVVAIPLSIVAAVEDAYNRRTCTIKFVSTRIKFQAIFRVGLDDDGLRRVDALKPVRRAQNNLHAAPAAVAFIIN